MTQTVGQRIREIAIAKALAEGKPRPTAKQIAASVGVRYESLRKWTTSATAPNRKRAAAIAERLAVPIGAFMLDVAVGDDEDDAPSVAPLAYSAQALEIAAIYDRVSPEDRRYIRAVAFASESEPEAPMPADSSGD